MHLPPLLDDNKQTTAPGLADEIALPADSAPSPVQRQPFPPRRKGRSPRWLPLPSRKQLLTVDLHDGMARVVLFQRGRVVAWGKATVPAPVLYAEEHEEEADESGEPAPSALNPFEQLRTLVRDITLGPVPTVVSLPSSICLMREVLLPRVDRRHFTSIVLSELMESVPFNRDDVDIAWKAIKTGSGFKVAANLATKQAMDQHLAGMSQGGVRAGAAYARPLALARAAGVEDGIVVEVGSRVVEVVLVKDGFPRLSRQVHRGASGSSQDALWVSETALAIEHMGELSEASPTGEQAAPLAISVIESAAPDDAAYGALAAATGRSVQQVQPIVGYPSHFPFHYYMGNIGLAMAHYAPPSFLLRSGPPRLPSIDLLPQRYRPKPLPWGTAAAAGLLVLMAVATVPASSEVDLKSQQATGLAATVNTLEEQVRTRDLTAARINVARTRLADSGVYVSALDKRLTGLQDDSASILARMEAITGKASRYPLQLSSVFTQGGSFSISGTSVSPEELLAYTASLRSLNLFQSVYVTEVRSIPSTGLSGFALTEDASPVSFQVRAVVEPPVSLPGQTAKTVLNLLPDLLNQESLPVSTG
ncbi:MAG: hypothetical protein HY532_01915 [Chloroflexi bacterium]|nr:hypothetical protein [Chloroflexota bacterium]